MGIINDLNNMNLHVKEHTGLFCYLVESESDPATPYYVDLTMRQGHGQCCCTHYKTTGRPNHTKSGLFVPYTKNKAGKVVKGVSECKHIEAARQYYHVTITQPMLAKLSGQ